MKCIGEMDANRPVPFRLTHNISEFITAMGVSGPLTASIIAAARCLVQPNFKVQAILRTVLRDEIMAWYKKVWLSNRFVYISRFCVILIISCLF